MQKQPLISVIIPAHNEENFIEKTILAIRNQTYKNFELIVVCDTCKDKTFEIAKRYTNKVYKKNYENISKTRNYGAKFAKGKTFIFMDADTVACKKYFQKVIDAVKSSYNYGCARLKSGTETIKGHQVTESLNVGMFLSNSTGGNLFITKKLFNKIKGFNELMEKGEDTELGLKANKNGGKMIFLKNTFLIHDERRYKNEGYLKLLFSQAIESILYFINKRAYYKFCNKKRKIKKFTVLL